MDSDQDTYSNKLIPGDQRPGQNVRQGDAIGSVRTLFTRLSELSKSSEAMPCNQCPVTNAKLLGPGGGIPLLYKHGMVIIFLPVTIPITFIRVHLQRKVKISDLIRVEDDS